MDKLLYTGSDHLADVLSRAFESNKNLSMRDDISLEVTLQPLPGSGSGRIKYKHLTIIDEVEHLRKLKGVLDSDLDLRRDLGLCLSASLYMAVILVTEGNGVVKRLKRRRNELRRKAREYCAIANLVPGPMGIPEIMRLQEIPQLANYSIALFKANGIREYFCDRFHF